ncbi:MAG: alpha/beta fold hydrolase [Synechococcales bacterium]|nr:alpha/beta fold hydrolase [Synechococcales bacterium]
MLNFVSNLYRTAASTFVAQQVKFREDRIALRNEKCRSIVLIPPKPTGKVCLFFHGFTAAPYQFRSIAQTFYQAGYTVLAPLSPGHGLAGDWNKTNPPPLPSDPAVYKNFAREWLKNAKNFGNEIIVGGLSGGGALAGWLAIEHAAEIQRALLFAPYLSNSSLVIDLIVQHFDFYSEWKENPLVTERIGYTGFRTSAIKAFRTIGQEVLTLAKTKPTPPMLILSTELDTAVNNPDHRDLYDAIAPRQPLSWYYCFDRALNIPHAMMVKEEGTQWENLLNVMVKAYVQSQLTWAEVEEIAYRMTEGKTFPRVVQELGLASKASPDMPAMMTMVNKREIVDRRNDHLRDFS